MAAYTSQGKDIKINVIRSDRRSLTIEVKPGKVVVRAPRIATDAQIEAFISEHREWIEKHVAQAERRSAEVHQLTSEELHALADRAFKYIPARVAYYAPLVGVRYGRITIRNQRTKWGSCSTFGNLNFNCLLMLAPPEVIDSVVVHELCHLKHMNHSESFYEEVLRVFPNYRECDRWLKENGAKLMAMQV